MTDETITMREDIYAQLASLRERVTRLEQKELVSTPASADPPWYVIAYTYHGEIMNLRGPYPTRGTAEDAARGMYIHGWATVQMAPRVQS